MEVGIDRVRLAEIARRASMSSGQVIYYFTSKEHILLETLAWQEHQDLIRRRAALAKVTGAWRQLDRFIGLYLPTGPADPSQELAGLLMFWHVHDAGSADGQAVERTLRAYYAACGQGRLRDEQSFGMYLAGRLNFLHGQASLALEPGTSALDRDYASAEVSDTLARLPTISLISGLVSIATETFG